MTPALHPDAEHRRCQATPPQFVPAGFLGVCSFFIYRGTAFFIHGSNVSMIPVARETVFSSEYSSVGCTQIRNQCSLYAVSVWTLISTSHTYHYLTERLAAFSDETVIAFRQFTLQVGGDKRFGNIKARLDFAKSLRRWTWSKTTYANWPPMRSSFVSMESKRNVTICLHTTEELSF